MELDFVSVHKNAKRELDQYPAILTSHLVNNMYIELLLNRVFITAVLCGIACVAGVIGEGEGGRGSREKMRGRGERERLPQEPHSIHFCVRWETQISDWLIFDSKSLEN